MAAVAARVDAALADAVAERRDRTVVAADAALREFRAAGIGSAADAPSLEDAAGILAFRDALIAADARDAAGTRSVERERGLRTIAAERNAAGLDPIPQRAHEPVHRV